MIGVARAAFIGLLLPIIGTVATLAAAPESNGARANGGDHWAFRPPVRPAVPEAAKRERVYTDIDRFIQSALEAKQLSIGPEADRAMLIRRVAFDLTGLPPTPDEIAAFLGDKSSGAYGRMVDRYLASPHYGARWGRHWLDAAGYADSNGYFHADTDRPLAYRYRDYVVRAFNTDKPFDRFLQEQIAGDELVGYRPGDDVTPEMVEPLVATHFLRNGPDGTGESDGNLQERQTDRIRVLEAATDITASALLGLTVRCARCHDHKFDPITQVEYYSLQAILSPALTPDPDRWIKPNDRTITIATRAEREAHEEATKRARRPIDALRKGLDAFASPLREALIAERLDELDPAVRNRLEQAKRLAENERTAEQTALIDEHGSVYNVADEDLAKRFPEFAALRKAVERRTNTLEEQLPPPLPTIAAVFEAHADRLPHYLFKRGVHTAPGEVVDPGVPAVLCTADNRFVVSDQFVEPGNSGRRLALARWLTAPQNPLFARVMVNRIWQHHFGRGLVPTPGNFGVRGARPTHPGLLDFLATEFMRRGWSIKAMHRWILASAVYRQSTAIREDAYAVDPDNHLYWCYPVRRLDAEAVRDAMLFVAGRLDDRFDGPYVPTQRDRDGRVFVDAKHPDANRRSIYLQQRRTQVHTLLEVFDTPGMVTNCLERSDSTIPLQSLALLNSVFAVSMADALAQRIVAEAGPTDGERLEYTFVTALGRSAQDDERGAATRFLAAQREHYGDDAESEMRVWADLCQMVFAGNAFLYMD